jgi:hypothetical protein
VPRTCTRSASPGGGWAAGSSYIATVAVTSPSWHVAGGPRTLACEEINIMVIEEIVSQGDGSRSVTGVELYRDRPQDEWPRTADGELAMVTRPLDVEGLLSELG